MNIETLADERLEAEFPERVKEHFAKPNPQSWRFPRDGGSLRQSAMRLALNIFRRVKNNRAYALDELCAFEFAAFAVACAQAGRNPAEAIAKLANIIALAIQEYREMPARKKASVPVPDICPPWQKEMPAEIAITALPTDPVTGQRVRNPYEKPIDGRSQLMLETTNSRLAAYLRAIAKYGGSSLAALDQLEADRIEVNHEREIVSKYDEKMWEANLLRRGSGATGTEQAFFVKGIEDATLLKVHRREAQLGSPSLQFDNLTIRMAIAKRDPALREIHAQAGEILKSWQAEATREKAA